MRTNKEKDAESASLGDELESGARADQGTQEQHGEAPVAEDRDQGQDDGQPAAEDKSEQEPVETESASTEKEEAEDTPIWMRYMSDEEIEEYNKKQQQQEKQGEQEYQQNEVEEGFIDDPVIDLTNQDSLDQEIQNLRDILQNDRDLFVEEIFRGSERAYEQAVEDIAAFDSWRDVSKYIEKEIFKRNLVDMYSEAAVDFTDQLQTYFLEKQNKSK
ncbi:MAG: hypothetical protein U5J63_09610 [Fodinibius sp.]|nr:hypothetical protein [Fodinibius sp.]